MNEHLFANILAQCLEALENGECTLDECLARYPQHAEELSPLLRAAARLREAPEVQPRAAFRAQARARLLEKIDPPQSVTFWQRLRHSLRITQTTQRRRFNMTWILILSLLGSLLGGGTVYASQNALPGDALYPIKIGLEEAQIALASSEADLDLYQSFAQTRLAEAQTLIEQGRYHDAATAMQDFQALSLQIMTSAQQMSQEKQMQALQNLQNLQAQMAQIQMQLQDRQMQATQEQAGQAAQEGMNQAGQAAQEGMDQAGQAAQEGMDQAGQAAQEGMNQAGQSAQEGLDEAIQAQQQSQEAIQQAIQQMNGAIATPTMPGFGQGDSGTGNGQNGGEQNQDGSVFPIAPTIMPGGHGSNH